jgi:hypothetical protein
MCRNDPARERRVFANRDGEAGFIDNFESPRSVLSAGPDMQTPAALDHIRVSDGCNV